MKISITRAIHMRFQAFVAVSLLAVPAIAFAQITQAPAPGIYPSYTHRNGVAFDPVHDVYLAVVWDPPFGAPLSGRFLDKAGNAITGDFPLVDDVDSGGNPAFASWSSVAFGGPPNDPAFIVTYVVAEGNNTKYGRIVRYVPGGAPTVSGRRAIVDVGSQWFAQEKAQSFWNGAQFVVGTRLYMPGGSLPTFVVNLFDVNLNISPAIDLGDGADFYGSPALACGSGTCLAFGFKAGIQGGLYSGGSYGRLFNASTLVPQGTAVIPISPSGANEEQAVVYQKHTGMFLTMWFRVTGGWIETRLVVPDGTLGSTNTAAGPNGGTTSISYNQFTQTTLLTTKDSGATLYALELGDQGTPIRPANFLILTNWDGAINDYLPSIAANEEDGQWLVAYRLAGTALGQIITGTHVDPTTVPLTVLTSSTLAQATHTLPFAQLMLASGGVIPYTWSHVSGTLPPGIHLNGAYLSGTPTLPGSYNFRLRVTSTDAQVAVRDFTLNVQAIIIVPPGGQGAHIEGPGPTFLSSFSHTNRNNLAYDPVHGVYLTTVHPDGGPITGRFLDRNGQTVGADFLIADDPDPATGGTGFLSWTGIFFGGPPSDPTFLLTYIVGDGNQVNSQKFARFVRYVPNGLPSVTGRIFIDNVGQQWFAAEKAQSVWTGQLWVIGTRVLPPGFSLPTFQVNTLTMGGALSAPVNLGDGLDFYGSPALACAANGVCIAVGFEAGINTGYSGGTYSRRFQGSSLAPLGALVELAKGLPNEDQGVVYQTHTGNFLVQWWRGGGAGFIDTRLVGTDGSMSILDMSKGIGPGAGANAIVFNPGTRTSLLVTKRSDAALIVMELGDDGYPLDPENTIVITAWDGSINDFYPSMAANEADRQWLVTARLASGTWGRIIQGSAPGTSYVVQNSSFSSDLTGWSVFAQPSPGSLVTSVVNGVLYFYRPPLPPGQTGQGVILQALGVALPAGVPVGADFDLGNTSALPQRITILLHDLDFSDLQVCTFWIPAGAPLRRYRMLSHTTAPWDNATISFYAATTSADGGAFMLDNVRTYSVTGQALDRTECVDPTTPAPYPFGDTPSFIANGSFSAGLTSWGTFGQIIFQLNGGVFEFARPPGTPAGVVLQPTGQALPLESRLKATFSLGNSSGNRRRITVLLHDADFSDFGVCSFWLPAGQGLAPYTMQFVVKKPWANATFAVYPATVDATPWLRLDDVSLIVAWSTPMVGTQCIEPPAGFAPETFFEPKAASMLGATAPAMTSVFERLDREQPIWQAVAGESGAQTFVWASPVDLLDARTPVLRFESRLSDRASNAFVEVTRDGVNWTRVAGIAASDDWTPVSVDLSAFSGDVVYVRFVYAGEEPLGGAPIEAWAIRAIRVDVRAPRTIQRFR